ncbi:hypothetical protein BHM03_00044206 [Ensete ventricosum]|nr:hypothetical protein BHM03_00044206 [Ensete ventricosum]
MKPLVTQHASRDGSVTPTSFLVKEGEPVAISEPGTLLPLPPPAVSGPFPPPNAIETWPSLQPIADPNLLPSSPPPLLLPRHELTPFSPSSTPQVLRRNYPIAAPTAVPPSSSFRSHFAISRVVIERAGGGGR